MYQGQNLYSYKMTSDESVLVESLRNACMETLNRLGVPREELADGSPYMGRLLDNHDFCIKFKKDIGYYVLDGERGVFVMRKGFPERDKEKAKFRILEFEFWSGGCLHELRNRQELELMWEKTYKIEYDSRKAAFEYAIQKHFDSMSCLTDEMIADYTGYMNKWFKKPYWYYNKEKMLFEEYLRNER